MLWQARTGLISRNTAALSPAAGGTPTLNYIATTAATIASLTATVTGASIGTAAADRLVVVAIANNFSNMGSGNTLAMTLDSGGGAVAMTQHTYSGNNGATTGIYSLTVPTGTTATIVGTLTGGAFANINFHVFTITGLSSTTPTGTSSNTLTASSVSTNVATTSGGVIIAALSTQSTFTNMAGSTETFTVDFSSTRASAHATGVATNASSTVTNNASGSASITVSAAAWR